ncbi:MAG: hypothetical protein WBB29_19545 [Geitlerinemataceae cyanobacterium]
MERKITWLSGSNDPDNGDYLDAIRQWWTTLSDREVSWKQRMLPQEGNPEELDWESARFDEVFAIAAPELRGITLYWRKPGDSQERNITARKLELDRLQGCLYIYSQSQQQVVLRVALKQISYQTLELNHPQLTCFADGDRQVLRFRDPAQQMDVKIILSPEEVVHLKQQL